MTITAKIICDSISEVGVRITSLQLRYPRFIHAEFMTHRVFSRNASSSRAVPVQRLIQDILDDTAMPIHWGKNQKGMQADEECNEPVRYHSCLNEVMIPSQYKSREYAWRRARDLAIEAARSFDEAGYHKQIVNRLLEPFSHINVLVTSTKWKNFFALRNHPDAQPEIRMLARAIIDAMAASKPKLLMYGDWHLPYITHTDYLTDNVRDWSMELRNKMIKVSVARCARVSYLTQENREPSDELDLKLYERLVGSKPLHASPAEHQATPDKLWYEPGEHWDNEWMHGNFYGWIQYRKFLRNEYVKDDYE